MATEPGIPPEIAERYQNASPSDLRQIASGVETPRAPTLLRGCAGGCGDVTPVGAARDDNGWTFTEREGTRPDAWCPACGAKRRPDAVDIAGMVVGRDPVIMVAANGHKIVEFPLSKLLVDYDGGIAIGKATVEVTIVAGRRSI